MKLSQSDQPDNAALITSSDSATKSGAAAKCRRGGSGAPTRSAVAEATSVPCVDSPGNHFQVFDTANIEAVSDALGRVCLDLDSK